MPVLSGNDWSPCSGIALIREIESNFEKMVITMNKNEIVITGIDRKSDARYLAGGII